MMGIDYGELDHAGFVQFLIDTVNASLEVETFPNREALQHLVDRLGWLHQKLVQMISISHWGMYRVDGLSPADLFRLAVYAFEIGSLATESENTTSVIKHRGTAPARATAAEKRAPDKQRIKDAIAEAEKIYPPGTKGRATAIDYAVSHKLKVSAGTVARHRKAKMLTL